MIQRVHFQNFKSLRDVTVELAPFTVLVGGNGSGKSSVLQGLQAVLGVATAALPPGQTVEVEHFWEPTRKFLQHLPSLGRTGVVFSGALAPAEIISRPGGAEFTVRVARDQTTWTEVSSLPAKPGGSALRLSVAIDGQRATVDLPVGAADPEADLLPLLQKILPGPVLSFRPDATRIASPYYAEKPDAQVSPEGDGVATVLQRLQGFRDERFDKIETGLRAIVPAVRRLRVVPTSVRTTERQKISVNGEDFWTTQQAERTGARIEIEMESVGWVPAHHVSEGTLISLGLLTVLCDQDPHLLLVDDIDKALHPTAQSRLVELLRQFQKERPHLQIVATTHSPYLLDKFAYEEVGVMTLRRGASLYCPLTRHPLYERRKDYMQTGEFWSGVGEDWLEELAEAKT